MSFILPPMVTVLCPPFSLEKILPVSQNLNVLLFQDVWTKFCCTYMNCDDFSYERLPILPFKTTQKVVLSFFPVNNKLR